MRIVFLVIIFLFQSFSLRAELRNNTDDSLASETKINASKLETKHFIIWYQSLFISTDKITEFSQKYELAYGGIEKILSCSFDAQHYNNQKIEVFLTKGGISHVYGGYQHAGYNLPWIYLPAVSVKEDISNYSHELTHLMVWKYSAHSLREGLATWIQIKLYEQGIGLNVKRYGSSMLSNRMQSDKFLRVLLKENKYSAIFDSIGSTGIPSKTLTDPNGDFRTKYYSACYSFVAFLLDSMDMVTFMKLYDADDPSKASKSFTERNMNEWKTLWIKYLTTS